MAYMNIKASVSNLTFNYNNISKHSIFKLTFHCLRVNDFSC